VTGRFPSRRDPTRPPPRWPELTHFAAEQGFFGGGEMAFDENESEKMPQAASPPGRHYPVQLPPMEHARAAMRATIFGG